MSLIHNERIKLLANALDRVSTAFIVVGVLGQALSLPPAGHLWISLLSAAGWLFCRRRITFTGKASSRETDSMTPAIFFWYVLPLLIGAAGLGWLYVDKHSGGHIHHPHPGE